MRTADGDEPLDGPVARCWWCRDLFLRAELVHLEGARIAGSPELRLPLPRAMAVRILVCQKCAIDVFAEARVRHNVEVKEAGYGD